MVFIVVFSVAFLCFTPIITRRKRHVSPIPTKWVKYNRSVCSGLGDRISLIFTVAALAKTMNATCYMFWCEENYGSYRYYAYMELMRYMVFPENIALLTQREFNIRAVEAQDIYFVGGELPASHAYDSVYTLASRTMVVPNYTVGYNDFVSAYRQIGNEWGVHIPIMHVRHPYIVLHLRQGDKTESDLDTDLVVNSQTYCTFDILNKLREYKVQVVLISDDADGKRKMLCHFGDILAVPANSGFTKMQIEMMDLAILAHSSGIIQHVTSGWSAYSSTVAMAKQIPLVTTLKSGWNRLNDFHEKGGCPSELMKCDNVQTFLGNFEQYKI